VSVRMGNDFLIGHGLWNRTRGPGPCSILCGFIMRILSGSDEATVNTEE
jgi:hypothetical protein